MDTTQYSKEENKLVESKSMPVEEKYSYIEILSAIENLQTELTNYTGIISEKMAVWEKRKQEAIKLGLDTIV